MIGKSQQKTHNKNESTRSKFFSRDLLASESTHLGIIDKRDLKHVHRIHSERNIAIRKRNSRRKKMFDHVSTVHIIIIINHFRPMRSEVQFWKQISSFDSSSLQSSNTTEYYVRIYHVARIIG